jgi:hypothetical protein
MGFADPNKGLPASLLKRFIYVPPAGFCSFMCAGLIPYSDHGEASKHSKKARQNPQIPGASAGRAADRAGVGGTAQSRDQPRRKRHRLFHRIAAAAG